MVPPPWIFIHGTNVVDGDLKAIFVGVFLLFFFFGLFPLPPSPSVWSQLVLFFGSFFYFSVFFVAPSPLEIFLATPLPGPH